MNTTPIDYLLSTLFLTLAVVTGAGVAFVLLPPITAAAFGRYGAVLDSLIFLLTFGASCALFARLLLRFLPLPPGRHLMTDQVFVVWKLYTVLYEFGSSALKPFTVMFLRPLMRRLFGAKVGKEVALGGTLVDPHLIRIGDGAIIGEGAVVTAHAITTGAIVLGMIEIEAGATIGVGAVIYPDVRVGAGSIVAANAVVRAGTQIPPDEFWAGIPARRVKSLLDESGR